MVHPARCSFLVTRQALRSSRAAHASCPALSGKHPDLDHAYLGVKLASQLCMQVQRTLHASDVVTKGDTSPVTIADYAAQACVAFVLQRGGTGARLVAEESADDLRGPEAKPMLSAITALVQSTVAAEFPGTIVSQEDTLALIDIGNSPGGSTGKHFVLDPIDGTRGFVGLRQYAVCLGLIEDGVVTMGLLGCPNAPSRTLMTNAEAGPSDQAGVPRDEVGVIFAAVKGEGAYCGPLLSGMPTQRIRCADSISVADAICMESYDSRHSDHAMSAAIVAALGITEAPLQTDSQLKYGLLSRGDAHLFLRFPHKGYREKIWDHCAGAAILEEAGAIVTDAAGRPLDFSKGRWLDIDGGIIAAVPSVHKRVLEVLGEQDLKGHL